MFKHWGYRQIHRVSVAALAVLVAAATLSTAPAGAATLLATFENPTPVAGDRFGSSVAGAAELAAIGDPADDTMGTDAGAVYLFDPVTTELVRTLHDPAPQAGAQFAACLASLNDDLVVAAPYADESSATDSGRVLVFAPGETTPRLVIPNPSPGAGDSFGYAIAAVGNDVLVGAPGKTAETGAAYLFDGATGALIRTYAPPQPQAGAKFGYALTGIAGGRIAVVAPTGQAVFVLDAATGTLAYQHGLGGHNFRNGHSAIAAAGDFFAYGNIYGGPAPPNPFQFYVVTRICRASDGVVLRDNAATNVIFPVVGDCRYGASLCNQNGNFAVGNPCVYAAPVLNYCSGEDLKITDTLPVDGSANYGQVATSYGSALAGFAGALLVGNPGYVVPPASGAPTTGRAYLWSGLAAPVPPAAPTGLSASDGEYEEKIHVSWNRVANAVSYDLYWNLFDDPDTAQLIGNTKMISFDDTFGDPDTHCWYWVKAKNYQGDSPLSAGDAGHKAPPCTAPPSAAPTGVTATDGAHPDKVTVSWNAVTGAVAYLVYASPTNDPATAQWYQNATGTSLDYPKYTKLEAVWFWVKAWNKCGEGPFSASDSGYCGTGYSLKLKSADFLPAAPTAAQPGNPLSLASWTIDGLPTNDPMWLEFLPSKTGGFSLARFGGTITGSHRLSGYSGGIQTLTPPQTLNWLPDGIYTVVAFANRPGTGGPWEPVYSDNWWPVAGKRLRVRNTQPPGCNLVLENAQFTRDGTTVTVAATIRNTGSGTSPAYGFWVETAHGKLSSEGLFTPADYISDGQKAGPLAPNATFSYSQTGSAPEGAALAVIADSTDLIPETNEQDNWAWNGQLPGACGAVLNLGIVNASIAANQLAPAELSPAGSLHWSCSVVNRSAVDSGPVWIELFASQTGGLDALRSGITLTHSEKISVPANTTQNFNFNQGFEGIPDGIYSVVAVVNRCGVGDNPGEMEPWGSGWDNLRHLPGRVVLRNAAAPVSNLVWLRAPDITRTGTTVTVAGTVKNAGTGAAGPFWTEVFYGRMDAQTGMFAQYGLVGEGEHCAGLAVDGTTTINRSGTVPEGSWVIGVITDSTDLVPETNETDNWDYRLP